MPPLGFGMSLLFAFSSVAVGGFACGLASATQPIHNKTKLSTLNPQR